MKDARVAEVAGRQFNRISRQQLRELGLSDNAIAHRVSAGRLVIVENGVLAVAPVLDHDPWGRWMGATLMEPEDLLSRVSAAAAQGFWNAPRQFETVTRRGSGGPKRHGGVLVFRSSTLEQDRDVLRGIPITAAPRTLLDLAAHVSDRALARAVREAVRIEATTVHAIADRLGSARGARGTARLAGVLARYRGLPLERARSGSEVRALEILRDAGLPLPRLNVRINGEEADLSWPSARSIVEIDGGPFHLDAGEDARKQAVWNSAGWTVARLPADEVSASPQRLIGLVHTMNVHR